MTDDQICAWIAEKVMNISPDGLPGSGYYRDSDGGQRRFNPLTGPADALDALDKWKRMGNTHYRTAAIWLPPAGYGIEIQCDLMDAVPEICKSWGGAHADLPRAICLALVKATEWADKYGEEV